MQYKIPLFHLAYTFMYFLYTASMSFHAFFTHVMTNLLKCVSILMYAILLTLNGFLTPCIIVS